MDKKDEIIDLLLSEGNILNKQSYQKFLDIDPDFDFNRFDQRKTPLKVLYFNSEFAAWLSKWKKDSISDQSKNKPSLKQSNSREININFPFKFKRKNDIELQSDMNIFFRDIGDVVYIEEEKERMNWKTKETQKTYYHLLYDNNKGNSKIKTFRFILHSVSKKATNWTYGHYLKGYEIGEELFKALLREKKFETILDDL